jgi:hypothetical protein
VCQKQGDLEILKEKANIKLHSNAILPQRSNKFTRAETSINCCVSVAQIASDIYNARMWNIPVSNLEQSRNYKSYRIVAEEQGKRP